LNLSSFAPERLSTPSKLFLVGAIFNGIGNGVFNVVAQLYLSSIGFGGASLGSIFMMNALSAAILTIPMGVLADRIGMKKMMLLGLSTILASVSIILFSTSIEMLMLAFLLIGIGNAAAVIFSPLYSSFFDREDMDKAFGLWGSLNILTMSLGSLLGFVPPYLVNNFGLSFRKAYWAFLAFGAVFFVAQYFFYVMSTRGLEEAPKKAGLSLNISSRGFVVKFSLIALVSSVAFGVFFGLFPYYVNQKYAIQSDALGTLFFASNLVSAAAQAVAPRVSKRFGALKTIAMTIGLAAPFYLLIPIAPSFTVLSVLYMMRLSFAAMAQPLMSSTFMKNLHDDEKSTANSIRMMSMQGGSVVGPWLGGQLMDNVSMELPAFLGGGLYVALALLTLFLFRNTGGTGMKALQIAGADLRNKLGEVPRPMPVDDST
jgi:MFS family permease